MLCHLQQSNFAVHGSDDHSALSEVQSTDAVPGEMSEVQSTDELSEVQSTDAVPGEVSGDAVGEFGSMLYREPLVSPSLINLVSDSFGVLYDTYSDLHSLEEVHHSSDWMVRDVSTDTSCVTLPECNSELDNACAKPGKSTRKRKSTPSKWKASVAKAARAAGTSYVNKSGTTIAACY